jgi:hypothetical protein
MIPDLLIGTKNISMIMECSGSLGVFSGIWVLGGIFILFSVQPSFGEF